MTTEILVINRHTRPDQYYIQNLRIIIADTGDRVRGLHPDVIILEHSIDLYDDLLDTIQPLRDECEIIHAY